MIGFVVLIRFAMYPRLGTFEVSASDTLLGNVDINIRATVCIYTKKQVGN